MEGCKLCKCFYKWCKLTKRDGWERSVMYTSRPMFRNGMILRNRRVAEVFGRSAYK